MLIQVSDNVWVNPDYVVCIAPAKCGSGTAIVLETGADPREQLSRWEPSRVAEALKSAQD